MREAARRREDHIILALEGAPWQCNQLLVSTTWEGTMERSMATKFKLLDVFSISTECCAVFGAVLHCTGNYSISPCST